MIYHNPIYNYWNKDNNEIYCYNKKCSIAIRNKLIGNLK